MTDTYNNYNNNNNRETKRSSRWQEKPSPKTIGAVNNEDDEAALQALLSSAQAHQQRKEQEAERKRERVENNNNSSKKRPRDESKPHDAVEGKDDYYGPASRANNNNNSNQDDKDTNSHDDPNVDKQKANFGLSGALNKDARTGNVYKGVVLKFQEPPEARTPNTMWRFYVFKGDAPDPIETLHVNKQSAFLIGRNVDICDIPVQHPSCSSQHAVLQYRALPRDDGRLHCQPYILDLESTNGTFLNGVRIDAARYYQLKKGMF